MTVSRRGLFETPASVDEAATFATLAWNERANGLAEGYYLAANSVMIAALDRSGIFRNLAASPLLFLCRHWYELVMKLILAEAKAEYGDIEREYARNHDLEVLWKSVREYVEGRWPNEPLPGASLDELAEDVASLVEVDTSTGTAFRYADSPMTVIFSNPFGIHVAVVQRRLERAHRSFDAIRAARDIERFIEDEDRGVE